MFKAAAGWVFAVLTVVAAYAGWVLAPRPAEIHPASAAVETWQLPDQAETTPAKAIEILAKAGNNVWGKLPDATTTKHVTPPDWRIIGSVSRGEMAFVIIRFDDTQTEQRVKVGEDLPGGNKIIRIGTGKVCVRLNGKERSLVF